MTKLCIVLLFGAIIALACGQDNPQYVPPQPHGNSTPTPTHPTEPTHSTTHTPSTSVPTKSTTEKTTTPLTTKPTPTSTKTPPTTPSSTTTVPPKPTSPPTTPKPTPTPEPPKPVEPTTGTWQVNHPGTNDTCLLLQFALQIEIPYNTTFNKTYIAPIDIPSNAAATGVCGNDSQSIILEWNEIQNISDKIILNFGRNSTTKKYRLTDIEVTVTPDAKNFPGINDKTPVNLHHKYDEFKTSLSKSYKCAKKQALNLTDETNKTRGTISVSHLQFEAFVNTTSKQFSSAEDCAPFDTPDVVPIAVGCALAALVLIVLIAYLIGRRRRQARGYLSM